MPTRTRADLRCDGVLEERDDLRVPLPPGVVQRRVVILPTGKRGEGCGGGGGRRGGSGRGAVAGAEGRRGACAGPRPCSCTAE